MKWTEHDQQRFETTRRSADNLTTSASLRKRAGRTRGASQPNELQLHIAVAEHLRRRGAPALWWFHPANGELRDGRTGAKLKAMGVRSGVPDLVLLLCGQLYALELKPHDGRLSTEQRACHAAIEAAGGIVYTAHTLDEALTVLNAWGAFATPKPARQIERIAAHG